jgi:hypothetical protein
MARIPTVVCLIAALLVAGCATQRQALADPAPDVTAASVGGTWSILHPFCSHPRWIEPDWTNEHPVAAVAVAVGVAAAIAVILFGVL